MSCFTWTTCSTWRKRSSAFSSASRAPTLTLTSCSNWPRPTLQIIGEAAWKVSDAFKDAHPLIPWKSMAGFRHRAVHDYFEIRLDIVWQIATTELRPLIEQLDSLIPLDVPPDAQF